MLLWKRASTFDFCRQATRVNTKRKLDQAAKLFTQTKLAGRGLRGAGAYLSYLEKEMRLWRARQGGSGVRPGATLPPPSAPTPKPVKAAPTTVPTSPSPKPKPRRQRKNSIKTRPQRAKTNTDNMDTRRGGHSKGKHGTQVSPKDHEDRLRTGRDPATGKVPVNKKGKPIIPKKSSGFDTNEEHLEALGKADAKLKKGIADGSIKPEPNGDYKIPVDVKNTGTSYRLDPLTDRVGGKVITTKINTATAIYRPDPVTGKLKLVTLFPGS